MKKGVYQLLIRLDKGETIPVGKLGTFHFPAGFYVYTGSAMGGLEARIARHLSKTKRFHWHIDYLLERSSIIRYAIRELEGCKVGRIEGCLPARLECQISEKTLALDGAQIVAVGFGSSDCRCASHLAYFEREPSNLRTTRSEKSELDADGRKPL